MKVSEKKDRKANAFTLIEVMAAILFVAIILPIAMKTISTSTSVTSDARNKRHATILAEYKMCEILLDRSWTAGGLTGDFGTDHSSYTWASEVVSRDSDDTSELSVSVYWQQKGYNRDVTITTLVYNGQ